jgi:hypothetical protein
MYSCVSSKNIYITGCGEGSLYNWIGNIGKKVPAHKGKVNALMYYNEFVYSGAADGKILIWKT